MLEGFKRHHLSKKEARRIAGEAERLLGITISKKTSLEHAQAPGVELILADGTPIFTVIDGRLVPTLHILLARREALHTMPRVVVDEGAVGPISRGADIMAPGILRVEGEFGEEDIVVVVDPKHQLPIAVAQAIYSSQQIREMKKGRALKNLHHVGDKIWKAAPPRRIA